jgi:hypothetical protein
MVEKVARALFDQEWAISDAEVRDAVWRDEAHSGYFIEATQAALEACHYAELVEALRKFMAVTDSGKLREAFDNATELLAKIGGAQ